MSTALYLLRCVEMGLSMQDLELLEIGMVWDMATESANDDYEWAYKATQADMNRF